MKKLFVLIIFAAISFYNCTPIAKVEREPRIRFPQTLVIMPYIKAPVNTGYEDSTGSDRDRILRINDELEDSLSESIYTLFAEKKLFSSVIKQNNKKPLQLEITRNIYRFYLENHSITLTKSYFKVEGEIVSTVTIKDFDGKNVFIKKYKLKAHHSFMGSPKTVAMDLYRQFLQALVNDLEVQLGGLAPYIERDDTPAAPVKQQQGDFWL